MGNRSFVFQLLVLMALSGCTLLPEQLPPSKRHDFGPPPHHQQKRVTPVRLLLIGVQTPAWLETTEIHYRLLYDDPTRLRAYAQNHWIAPPAALLEQRWREALSGDTAVSIYQFEAALDRFEQVFDTPDSAYAVIGLRAVLMRPDQSAVAAERRFTIRRACPPHVQGAIEALASLADSMLEDVLRWAIEIDKLIPVLFLRHAGSAIPLRRPRALARRIPSPRRASSTQPLPPSRLKTGLSPVLEVPCVTARGDCVTQLFGWIP